MATTNIDVNKQNVVDLLKSGKDHPFVIPEYQRPYAWSDDEVITLFDDIWNFSIERSQGTAKNYFLGSIVSFENEQGEKEIIDGQQRITSLFLLLRAVYSKLESEENKTDKVQNFMLKIQPALWQEDELTGKVDKTKILLRSEVATDHGNEILRHILESGTASKDAKDNYSRNFNKFVELYEEKAKNSGMNLFPFINALLNYSILLPISADSQDTALTIFSTLNNRGLPLSDADIFKSYLYKQLGADEKKQFAHKWKELESEAAEYGESIQSLFYYQMFHQRAIEADEKTTIPGVRKYYLDKKQNRLTVDIIDKLADNLNLWKVIHGGVEIDKEPWSKNLDILKILDCISSYTNEFWKYPVLIFYNTYKHNPSFEQLFLRFLRKFCVLLLRRYLASPTINAIKTDILKLDVLITQTPTPVFAADFKADVPDDILVNPHRNMVRMLLKILAYNSSAQTTLLPDRWEIEHIFPQKWDESYFSISEDDANSMLECLGNKIPLEKPMNIKASNNYFYKKKEQYVNSKIALALELGNATKETWNLSDIEERNCKVNAELSELLDRWVSDYDESVDTPSKPQLTPEQQEEMIRSLKAAGFDEARIQKIMNSLKI